MTADVRESVTHPAPEHLPVLDGLRGIAILAVLISHFGLFPLGSRWHVLDEAGWAGVDLFFVLSGFLITRILLQTRARQDYFARFYARRTLRIFPLYYASSLLIAFVLPALGLIGRQIERGYEWAPFLYLQNYLPESILAPPTGNLLIITWSLCIEEQFYLLWPALVRWTRPQRLAAVCWSGIAIALATRVGAYWLAPDNSDAFRWMPARLDSLLLGALVAIAFVRDPHLPRLRPWLPWTAAISCGGLLLIAGFSPSFHFRQPLVRTLGLSAIALLCASWLGLAVSARGEQRISSSRVLGVFGKYSYGLYLLHSLAGGFTSRAWKRFGIPRDTVLGQLAFFAAATSVSLLLALISWYLLEQPFLRLKERWSDALRDRNTAPFEGPSPSD
jgi:peptidoglycan/LPS O-acetylase OafA/YrhL